MGVLVPIGLPTSFEILEDMVDNNFHNCGKIPEGIEISSWKEKWEMQFDFDLHSDCFRKDFEIVACPFCGEILE